MQTLTIRIPDWMHMALRQAAHDANTSMNQICVDILYDALVTTVIDEVIAQDKKYRIVRCGERYAIVWGDEFTDLVPAVQVVSPELGVVWFNTKEAAIAEASAFPEPEDTKEE